MRKSVFWLLFYSLFVLSAHADQSVTLAWDPNPEPDVSGYIVYFGNASRNYPYSTNVGNVTTATVYGLQEGLTYYFAITATNTSGLESDYSNEVTNAVPADLTNTVPTITPVADQIVSEDQITPPIGFTVSDVETSVSNLIVWASSTNTSLVPIANLHQSGNGAQRTVQIQPATNAVGVTLITLTVSDGAKASSTSFLLTVSPSPNPYDQWLRQYFAEEDLADPGKATSVWGANADADHDGLDNLIEYALGLRPDAGESSQEALVTSLLDESSQKHLALTFVRRKNDPSLQYIPEVSADKQQWIGPGAVREVGITDLTAEFEGVTYQDITPVTPGQPRWMRLRVIKN